MKGNYEYEVKILNNLGCIRDMLRGMKIEKIKYNSYRVKCSEASIRAREIVTDSGTTYEIGHKIPAILSPILTMKAKEEFFKECTKEEFDDFVQLIKHTSKMFHYSSEVERVVFEDLQMVVDIIDITCDGKKVSYCEIEVEDIQSTVHVVDFVNHLHQICEEPLKLSTESINTIIKNLEK